MWMFCIFDDIQIYRDLYDSVESTHEWKCKLISEIVLFEVILLSCLYAK